ncbi:peptidase C45 [bacterium]|nr:MAG: peptidase C45 [bacterium]
MEWATNRRPKVRLSRLRTERSYTSLMIAPLLAFLLIGGPAPVQADRLAGASREEREGWVCVKISGTPSEIGYQHGALLAPEIADAKAVIEEEMRGSTGKPWSWFRDTAKELYWDQVTPELKQEMKGIAEGASEKGTKVDVWDILALNAHIELEGYYLPWLKGQASQKEACSAFVATGSWTKDSKPVMGHSFWWGWTSGQRFKAVLTVKPDKGHAYVMDALPGFVHSGTDWAINDAGMVLCETTISGFAGYDPEGIPEFVRMRRAVQFGDSIDSMAEIFRAGNNGGYANAWLMADAKTGEIGKLELGLKHTPLAKTKDGTFYGANFPEHPSILRDEIPDGWNTNLAQNGCEARRARWKEIMAQEKGKIDTESAKRYLADTKNVVTGENKAGDGTLCGRSSWGGAIQAKVTNATMIGQMRYEGRMGAPDGVNLKLATPSQKFLKDMPARPWVGL